MDIANPDEIRTDLQLITETLAGKSDCYEVLFDRYRGQLYASILQKSGNERDAKDILQETFVKSYFNLGRFSPEYSFGQWIHTIARNLFIDHTRRKRRGGGTTVSIDGEGLREGNIGNPASDSLNPEEKIISEQRARQLDKLMGELSENYRIMIELRFVRELSYEEIAEKLDKPIGTVKTQIHRARERLSALIKERKIL